eukprot:gene12198-15323_t
MSASSSKRDRSEDKVKLRLCWTGSEAGDSPTSSHNESIGNKITLDALQERLQKKFKQDGEIVVRCKGLDSSELLETDSQLQAIFDQYFLDLELSHKQHSSSSANAGMATYRLKLLVSAASSSLSERSESQKHEAMAVQPAPLPQAGPPNAAHQHCLRPRSKPPPSPVKASPCEIPTIKKQKKLMGAVIAPPLASPRVEISWDRGVLRSIIKTVAKHHYCSVQPTSCSKLTT